MHALYTLSVFVHVLAACTWIGAMIFFGAVVVPVVRRPEYAGVYAGLLRRLGARFRLLGWISVAVLVATGIINLALRGAGLTELTSSAFWRSPFGRTLSYKLTLVALTVAATGAHDVLSRTWMSRRVGDPITAEARRARRVASWLGRVILLLSVAALLFGVWLVRGMPG
jgi:uncharacterized membrane protein